MPFLFASCASIAGNVRLYEGQPLPLDQIAILTHRNPYSRTIVIASIDRKPIPMGQGVIELTPGRHVIETGFIAPAGGSTVVSSTSSVSLELNAQAGHVYEIHAVQYQHLPRWYPMIRDVTDELVRPEKADLARKIIDVLNKNRAGAPPLPYYPEPSKTAAPLPGFGESRTATVAGKGGQPLQLTYKFSRYYPFTTGTGSDGRKYCIRIDEETGNLRNVFGSFVSVGDWKMKFSAFQPFLSDYAYVTANSGRVTQAYRLEPNGEFAKLPDIKMAPPFRE